MKLPDASEHDPSAKCARRLIEQTQLTIREIAARTGVAERTLRCYKDAGPSHLPMPYVVQYALESLVNARRRAHRRSVAGADRNSGA